MPTCPHCQNETGLNTLSCPRCGDGLPLEPGSVIEGRYEVLERLGAGGMGTVFKARDRDLEQNVAIKVVRLGVHAQTAARFRSEIKLARRVKHRNVCAVWANGHEGEHAYIVMELVEGRTLRELVQEQGPLGWDEACHLALQAAEGLHAIHEAGVIHRDVKTSNLMIDGHGVVRLVDFGIAKGDPSQRGPDLIQETGITDTNQLVGSPAYMSPEQIRGDPLDRRSDVYAFGVVLYELLTGRVPFHGSSVAETLYMQAQLPPVLDVDTVPTLLVPILARTLAKSPAERYPNMSTLIADLRQARATLAGMGTDTYVHARSGPWPFRGQARVFILGTGLALGVGLLLRALAPREPVPSTMPPSTTVSPSPTTVPSPSAALPRSLEVAAASTLPVRASPKTKRSERPVQAGTPSLTPPTPVPTPVFSPAPPPTLSSPDPEPTPAPTATPTPTPHRSMARGQLYAASDADVVRPKCEVCTTVFPTTLEILRLEGEVDVEILVDEDGRVQEAHTIGNPRRELASAAIATVKRWRYRPATRDGVPGKMRIVVPVSFVLRER